ncbi:SOS response-associated peptidase [Sediminitomix flava]|nr:SOS response-associated peptidase [Sediminitomix flava]
MCGRYSLITDEKSLLKQFRLKDSTKPIIPRFNAAPGQLLPVVTNLNKEKIQHFHWGFISKFNSTLKPINARTESIRETKMFRNAFNTQACIVFADGYYEWEKNAKQKIPYRIQLESKKVFAMAGIWSTINTSNTIIESFSILTKPASESINKIHDRMPVILNDQNIDLWLDNNLSTNQRYDLITNPNILDLSFYTVNPKIGNVRNDSKTVIEPYKYYKQKSLFL